jgi:hypothetical protein
MASWTVVGSSVSNIVAGRTTEITETTEKNQPFGLGVLGVLGGDFKLTRYRYYGLIENIPPLCQHARERR